MTAAFFLGAILFLLIGCIPVPLREANTTGMISLVGIVGCIIGLFTTL